MAGTTGLEPAASAVTERFYNNLQDRGDCQGPPKSLRIAEDTLCCGLNCGLGNYHVARWGGFPAFFLFARRASVRVARHPPETVGKRYDSVYPTFCPAT